MATEQVKTWFDVILALVNWPFLLFTFLIIFVLKFREKIVGLLDRGDIQISWGDNRHIKLKELSDDFDKEIDPIRDEIQELRDKINELSGASTIPSGNVVETKTLDDTQVKAAKGKILEGLENPKFRWRSVERLAILSGLSESDVLDLLRNDPNVVLSAGKTKGQIARLKAR